MLRSIFDWAVWLVFLGVAVETLFYGICLVWSVLRGGRR